MYYGFVLQRLWLLCVCLCIAAAVALLDHCVLDSLTMLFLAPCVGNICLFVLLYPFACVCERAVAVVAVGASV